jgi:hypothetical protein
MRLEKQFIGVPAETRDLGWFEIFWNVRVSSRHEIEDEQSFRDDELSNDS